MLGAFKLGSQDLRCNCYLPRDLAGKASKEVDSDKGFRFIRVRWICRVDLIRRRTFRERHTYFTDLPYAVVCLHAAYRVELSFVRRCYPPSLLWILCEEVKHITI